MRQTGWVSELEDRVEDFLRAPVAAAVLVLADRAGLYVEDLGDSATLSALAATAMGYLSPWNGGEPAAGVRERALALARPLRDLATDVLADPRNTWWAAPLDRSAQLLLTDTDTDPMDVAQPEGPNQDWEVYAQKPVRHLTTSTELPGRPADAFIQSGAHAELACGGGDWIPAYPLHQVRLLVGASARVYEVHSPADWHALVLRYADLFTHPSPDAGLLSIGGIDHGPAPTWSAAAEDLDGIHVSLSGLLTASYVPFTSGGITTTLWAWDFECTRWLRSVFTAAEPVPDLLESPRDPGYHHQW